MTVGDAFQGAEIQSNVVDVEQGIQLGIRHQAHGQPSGGAMVSSRCQPFVGEMHGQECGTETWNQLPLSVDSQDDLIEVDGVAAKVCIRGGGVVDVGLLLRQGGQGRTKPTGIVWGAVDACTVGAPIGVSKDAGKSRVWHWDVGHGQQNRAWQQVFTGGCKTQSKCCWLLVILLLDFMATSGTMGLDLFWCWCRCFPGCCCGPFGCS